ncbi:unnamed protein product, partial [Discosporangium mesarthrocarpum]
VQCPQPKQAPGPGLWHAPSRRTQPTVSQRLGVNDIPAAPGFENYQSSRDTPPPPPRSHPGHWKAATGGGRGRQGQEGLVILETVGSS